MFAIVADPRYVPEITINATMIPFQPKLLYPSTLKSFTFAAQALPIKSVVTINAKKYFFKVHCCHPIDNYWKS